MANVMTVLTKRNDVESEGSASITEESIQEHLYSVLPDTCNLYFKDGSKVSVDGQVEPEKLTEIVRTWNQNIQEKARISVKRWAESEFSLDSIESFEARKAVMAADDYFNFNGLNSCAVVNQGWDPYFSVLVPPALLEQVERSPENFVILDAVYDY